MSSNCSCLVALELRIRIRPQCQQAPPTPTHTLPSHTSSYRARLAMSSPCARHIVLEVSATATAFTTAALAVHPTAATLPFFLAGSAHSLLPCDRRFVCPSLPFCLTANIPSFLPRSRQRDAHSLIPHRARPSASLPLRQPTPTHRCGDASLHRPTLRPSTDM